MKYEIRQIDTWGNKVDGYEYNTTYHVCDFVSVAQNEKKLFTRQLKKHGIVFKRNRSRIVFDGSIWEIVDRKTQEPLFCMIPEM